MSVVIAVSVEGAGAIMASDSARQADGMILEGESKVLRVTCLDGDALVGYVGGSATRHVYDTVVDTAGDLTIRRLIDGLASKSEGQDDGTYMIATAANIWVANSGFATTCAAVPYPANADVRMYAVGCGGELAMGAFMGMEELRWDTILIRCVSVACRLNAHCDGPVHTVSTPGLWSKAIFCKKWEED